MSHNCMIAIKEGQKYRSIYCHFLAEEAEKVAGPILRNHYNSLPEATGLVDLGDLNDIDEQGIDAFYRDWGHPWNEVRPAIFSNKKTITEYAGLIRCRFLYVFEYDEWHTIEILKEPVIPKTTKKTVKTLRVC